MKYSTALLKSTRNRSLLGRPTFCLSTPFFSFSVRPSSVSRKGLKFYLGTFFFLFLSIHRAQQPRSGWSSNAFLRFGRNFEPLAFENAAKYSNAKTHFLCRNDRPMSSPSLAKLAPRTTENRLSVVPYR